MQIRHNTLVLELALVVTVQLILAIPSVGAWQSPQVVSRLELSYPPMARAAGIKGEVVVDLSIGPDGLVETATVVSGHPLLKEPTRTTLAAWAFEASPHSEPRSIRLTVMFGDVSQSDDGPAGTQISYSGPNAIYITYIQSTIARLPREGDGSIPARYCPVHNELMQLDIVPIRYGLPTITTYGDDPESQRRLRRSNTYYKAIEKYFPEANRWVGGGCSVQVERKAEVLYCQTCRAMQDHWHDAHPSYPRQDY